MKLKILNLVVFNIAWFACILGAGSGNPWLGPIAVLISAVVHLYLLSFAARVIALYIAAFIVGFASDWIVMLLGAVGFPEHARLLTPVPLWMSFMWINFATTLHFSMSWMNGRYLIAALFGLLGGPGAYYTGMKFDAITLGESLFTSLFIIGIQWALAMPLLVWLASFLRPDINDPGLPRVMNRSCNQQETTS
ncbi:MAG: DUF2878 domain-containing protein [Phycisphaerales bacterium]